MFKCYGCQFNGGSRWVHSTNTHRSSCERVCLNMSKNDPSSCIGFEHGNGIRLPRYSTTSYSLRWEHHSKHNHCVIISGSTNGMIHRSNGAWMFDSYVKVPYDECKLGN